LPGITGQPLSVAGRAPGRLRTCSRYRHRSARPVLSVTVWPAGPPDAQTASPAGAVGCGHGTGPTASGRGPGRPRPSGPGRPVSRIFISFPAGDAGWAAIGSVPFLLMSPRPRSRNFRKPADLISNPNITEPRPPPELGPKFVLAWVPR